ncbi:MAG TPA: SBBP repeat-containing protein, partial [Planctomycetota bacterium]|nr:SBBP repeat-containing protein [Planctomycetota bacterium]
MKTGFPHLATCLFVVVCSAAAAGEAPVNPGLAWATVVAERVDTMMSDQAIAIDAAGNAVVVGTMSDSLMMGTEPGFDTTYRGIMNDAFVAKFSRGGVMRWGMYLGGFGADHARAVVTDAEGSIYVVGNTSSNDFPVTEGLDTEIGGISDLFVARLAPAGNLVWATFIGGSGDESADDVALLSDGGLLVTGTSSSNDFATLSGQDPMTSRIVAVRLSADGQLVWAKGVAPSMGPIMMMGPMSAIAVTPSGGIFIAGRADSAYPFTVPGGFDTTLDGMTDVFLMHLNDAGTVDWGTFIGGDGGETFADLKADGAGNLIIAGSSMSTDFAPMGDNMTERLFTAKVSSARLLEWAKAVVSSGLPGKVATVAPAPDGTIYFACTADSMASYPTPGGFDTTVDGMSAAYVARLSASGNIEWGTFIDGDQMVDLDDIAVARDRGVYLVGYTNSSDFPPGRPVDPMGMYNAAYLAKLADFRLSVKSAPFADVPITGDRPGTTDYSIVCEQGEAVTLNAPLLHSVGGVRYDLVRWVVDGVNQPDGQASVNVIMKDSVSAEVLYSVRQWTLTVLSAPFTGVSIAGSLPGETLYAEVCDDQTAVTLTAPQSVRAEGRDYVFVRWLLDNVSQPRGRQDLSLLMDQGHTALAMYEIGHHVLTVKSTPIDGVEITGDKAGTTPYLEMCTD